MGYVRTGGMSTAARRRRRRTALVLTAVVLLLLLVFGYAAAYYQGWIGTGSTDSTSSTSAPSEEPALQPADVTLNVYNATGKTGLAGRTAEALKARGFVVDAVADDPTNATVEHVADVRYGRAGAPAARLLRESIPGAKFVRDEREGATIDLVLGAAFEELPELPADDSATTAEPAG